MSLSDKYAPTTLNGIIGNGQARSRLAAFGIEVLEGKKVRPLILCGVCGIGKTSAAHALAYSHGLELVELNASDYRDSESLNQKVLPLAKTRGLFNKKCLIVFDEVDELSSKFDSGAESIIRKFITESRHPIIFIANDYWNRKISFLRDSAEKVDFKRPEPVEVIALLERVAKAEGKEVKKEIISEIVKRSNGDVRAALNDLEMMFGADPELINFLGMRDRKSEIFRVLDRIFLSSNFDIARNSTLSSDIELDMLINWIGQNIPSRYLSTQSISEAYEQLSRASMFNEVASRKSYYGYWRYSNILLSSGVSLANNGSPVNSTTPYAFPATIRHLSKTKKDRSAINEIALKLTAYLHANRRTVIGSHLPIMALIINLALEKYGPETVFSFMEQKYQLEKSEVQIISAYSWA
ncbi:MAG: replication factor C large subunit [Candidatus Micrarchaeota archaeon]|nr:replication factor C large subunit [Candidatus Micrarchaeota archaeon]MDE1834679.1 replication factor C large subunit [Candidatus Micrarchaeota archaeon]MDE1859140.1 replication factor C large subunit [Candidatus Micrarchaeota archaeon]